MNRILTLLDVASLLHGLAFFKVSKRQQRQIVSTTFKIYYQTQNLKLMIFKTNYFYYFNSFFVFNISLKILHNIKILITSNMFQKFK